MSDGMLEMAAAEREGFERGGCSVVVGLLKQGAGDSAAVSLRLPSPRVAAVEAAARSHGVGRPGLCRRAAGGELPSLV